MSWKKVNCRWTKGWNAAILRRTAVNIKVWMTHMTVSLNRDGSVLGCTVLHVQHDLQDFLSSKNSLDSGANSLQQRKLQAASTRHLQFCYLCLPLSKSELSSHATVFNEQSCFPVRKLCNSSKNQKWEASATEGNCSTCNGKIHLGAFWYCTSAGCPEY